MTTRRLILACIVAAILSIAITATAHASPVPDETGSDCGWHEDGTTIEIGDHSFTCHCAQLTGPNGPQVLCRWYRDDVLPAKSKKRAARRIVSPKVKRIILRVAVRPVIR